MSKFLLLGLLIAAIVFRWKWKAASSAAERKILVRNTLLWGLGIGIVLLAATGKIHWLGVVFAAMFPFLKMVFGILIRYFPFLAQIYRSKTATSNSPPKTSTVRSRILELTLNHETGELSGRVVEGHFSGSELDDLDQTALQELQNYCAQHDIDSLRLLESYLNQRFGSQSNEEASQTNATPSSAMSIQEALDILGLADSPSKQDIRTAHRRLIQKLHPDHGGNHYLAAKINQARDFLLKHLSSTSKE